MHVEHLLNASYYMHNIQKRALRRPGRCGLVHGLHLVNALGRLPVDVTYKFIYIIFYKRQLCSLPGILNSRTNP
jgi:hypothetical protein